MRNSGTRGFNKRKRRAKRRLIKEIGKCVQCGSTNNLTIDHIEPRSVTRNNSQSNWQVLCWKCNHEKGNKITR